MKRILVLGDSMVDRYLYGSVVKLSPEAPVPVVRIDRTEQRAGAAENVYANIKAMGVRGQSLKAFYGTGDAIVKTRLIGDGHHIARIDDDPPQGPISVDWVETVLGLFDIAVLIDYNKGSLAHSKEIIAVCKTGGKEVFVDPKGHDITRYHGADMIKPNTNELREMVGGWRTEEEMVEKAHRLRRAIDLRYLLLTRGPNGMILITGSGEWAYTHKVIPAVVDVSGAGEAAISAFSVAVAKGYNYPEATYYANKAAGLCVERFGTVVITEKEVFECQTGEPG